MDAYSTSELTRRLENANFALGQFARRVAHDKEVVARVNDGTIDAYFAEWDERIKTMQREADRFKFELLKLQITALTGKG